MYLKNIIVYIKFGVSKMFIILQKISASDKSC